LAHYAPQVGVHFRDFALSSATTRWGSCSSTGTIRLNWRLIHFSLDVIDYVVVHELAHLREMNHSPRFWAVVEAVMPDYRHARATLKRPAPGAIPRFAP
jgi:predicted metal-dependent hydrolase